MTADDVAYSFQILKDHQPLDRYRLWSDTRLKSVAVQGADTVTFQLNQPFASLPYYLSTVYIVPKHIFSQQNPETFRNMKPIGSGPFKFERVNASAIILDKNSNYFNGQPKIDQLEIDRYNNSSSLTLALEKGDIDNSDGSISMPSLPKLEENSAVKMQIFPGLSVYSVILNNEKPGLNDPAVRKAIQLAIDGKTLREKGDSLGTPASPGFLSPVFGDMSDAGLLTDVNYQFNLDKANRVLQNAGYKKNSKGVYEKDGKELSFVYYMQSNAPAQNKQGSMITEWLKQLGIATSVKLVTGPELTKLAMSGDYELIQLGQSFPPDPQAALEIFDSQMTAPTGQNTPGLNYMRYRDPDVDGWLQTASITFDPNKRKELYYKIQERIADEAPFAGMYNGAQHFPYRVDTFTNYNTDVPVISGISLTQVKMK